MRVEISVTVDVQAVIWVVTPRSDAGSYWRCGGTLCPIIRVEVFRERR